MDEYQYYKEFQRKGKIVMRGLVLRWILNIGGIILTSYVISGFEVTFLGAVFGFLVLGVVNAVIRPIIVILTLPLNFLTLGLFTLVINGFMLWLTSAVVKGFNIHGFGTAIIVALVFSLISFIISLLVKDRKE
jgi:putative membrane protein